jgi:hypothetical protein
MIRHLWIVAIICVSIAPNITIAADAAREALPWDTCWVVEGKGGDCGPGKKARPFEDFLDPGMWPREPQDGFYSELEWDLTHREPPIKSSWTDLGILGASRVRVIRYLSREGPFAQVLVAERAAGLFAPLMEWEGGMAVPSLKQSPSEKLLVLTNILPSNHPSVGYDVFVWREQGPILLDLQAPVLEGISKVAPKFAVDHPGASFFDWESLQSATAVGIEGDEGRTLREGYVKIWYALGSQGLEVKRAEFQDGYGDSSTVYKWP